MEKYRDRLLRAALRLCAENRVSMLSFRGDVEYLAEVDAVLGEIADARAVPLSQPPDIGGDVPGGGAV
jgi:hypothetical protein